ncbi:MAG: shikimate dehydrogenase [Sandaracinus sp.]
MSVRLAVVGHPIAHSLSPVMHRAALAALGRHDVTYDAIEVAPAALASELSRLFAEGYRGSNVTLPHKLAVLAHCVEVDDVARAIGAANTLSLSPRGWVATNTDAPGLARSLEESGVEVGGARAVVLGTGGAARAAALALSGADELVVVGRRVEVAREVATLHRRGRAASWLGLGDALAQAALLVQATSATLGTGAEAFASSIPLDRMPASSTVVDLVYRPRVTALLARAEARGLRTVDGVGMLVHQGALALERWLGVRAPTDVMREAVLAALA